jgi:DNA-binding transcriptional ArsR family regulator
MPARSPTQQLSSRDADVFAKRMRILATPSRLLIVHHVHQAEQDGEPLTVTQLCPLVNLKQPAVSIHVQRLIAGQVLTATREHGRRTLRINTEGLVEILAVINRWTGQARSAVGS